MNVYDFMAMRGNGQEVPLKEYKGKVLIIVNTASMRRGDGSVVLAK